MDEVVGCEAFLQCISEYLDDDLRTEVRIQFEKHLKYCVNARAMVHTVEQTIVLHRRAGGEEPMPEAVHDRLRGILNKYVSDNE